MVTPVVLDSGVSQLSPSVNPSRYSTGTGRLMGAGAWALCGKEKHGTGTGLIFFIFVPAVPIFSTAITVPAEILELSEPTGGSAVTNIVTVVKRVTPSNRTGVTAHV